MWIIYSNRYDGIRITYEEIQCGTNNLRITILTCKSLLNILWPIRKELRKPSRPSGVSSCSWSFRTVQRKLAIITTAWFDMLSASIVLSFLLWWSRARLKVKSNSPSMSHCKWSNSTLVGGITAEAYCTATEVPVAFFFFHKHAWESKPFVFFWTVFVVVRRPSSVTQSVSSVSK